MYRVVFANLRQFQWQNIAKTISMRLNENQFWTEAASCAGIWKCEIQYGKMRSKTGTSGRMRTQTERKSKLRCWKRDNAAWYDRNCIYFRRQCGKMGTKPLSDANTTNIPLSFLIFQIFHTIMYRNAVTNRFQLYSLGNSENENLFIRVLKNCTISKNSFSCSGEKALRTTSV